MAFDINDAYWIISGQPLLAWSSARFTYVATHTDAAFQAWVAADNRAIQVSTQALADVMRLQRVPNYLLAGVSVTFTNNSSLTARYALDPLSMDQVGTLARDTASGFGFPGGSISFQYPDFNSNPLSFSSLEIQQLYVALRDYINSVYQGVAALVLELPGAQMPGQSVTVG